MLSGLRENGVPMINKNDLEFETDQFSERQQLVWKGALILLCAGLFALVAWSSTRDNQLLDRCASAQANCLTDLRSQPPQPPAKGALSPLRSASDHQGTDY
jgi:hypothetical protein